MIEPAKYYEIMEQPFRALDPDRTGFMNFGLWPADTLKEAQENLVRATLDALALQPGDPKRVLEAGSGWGASRRLVGAKFPGLAYVGVNFSRNQVEHSRAVNRSVPQTTYVQAEIGRAHV